MLMNKILSLSKFLFLIFMLNGHGNHLIYFSGILTIYILNLTQSSLVFWIASEEVGGYSSDELL